MKINNKINIDNAKCTGCGVCIDECPPGVLELHAGKSTMKDSDFCISCGHCAMVCPELAIESSENNKLFFEVKDFSDGGEVAHLLESKRSARVFKDEAITPEIAEKIIEYGEMAPSAQNKRDRKYILLQTKEDIDSCIYAVLDAYKPIIKFLNPLVLKLISLFSKKKGAELNHLKVAVGRVIKETEEGNDKIFRGAKCVILVAGPEKDLFSRDDCIVSQHYMMLYAESIGVGSVVAGYAQWAHKKIEKKLNLKKGYAIYAISAFGYNKYHYKRSVRFKAEII